MLMCTSTSGCCDFATDPPCVASRWWTMAKGSSSTMGSLLLRTCYAHGTTRGLDFGEVSSYQMKLLFWRVAPPESSTRRKGKEKTPQ